MLRGDKSKYTDKQKRQAEHIEEGYEKRGVSKEEPKAAPGHREQVDPRRQEERLRPRQIRRPFALPQRRAQLGGKASARRPAAKRSASAKKAARTRKERAA